MIRLLILLQLAANPSAEIDSLITGDTYFEPVSVADIMEPLEIDSAMRASMEFSSRLARKGRLTESLVFLAYGEEIARSTEDERWLAAILDDKAVTLRKASAYREAVEAALEALAINTQLGNEEGLVDNHNSLGVINLEMRNYAESKDNFFKGLAYAKVLNDKKDQGSILSNLGLWHERRDQFDSARHYYNLALAIDEEVGNTVGMAIANNNIAILYQVEEDFREALRYSLRAVEIDEKNGDQLGLTYSLNTTIDSYRKLGLRDSAITLAERNYEIAKGLNSPHRMAIVAEVVYKTYRDFGLYDQAMPLVDEMVASRDSVFSTEKSKQIQELQTKYESEKKQQYIATLQIEKAAEVWKRNAMATGMVMALLLGGTGVVALKMRMRKNKKIREQERQLEAAALSRIQNELEQYTRSLVDKQKMIEQLNHQLQNVQTEISIGCPSYAGSVQKLMQSTILTDEEWTQFQEMFLQVYPGFFARVRQEFPDISPTEERLLALTRLSLSSKEIAGMLGVSSESVKKSRYRLKKKLGVSIETTLANLENISL